MFKEFRIYLTEDNDFEFLKQYSSKILLHSYLTHIIRNEFKVDKWSYSWVRSLFQNFGTDKEIEYDKFYESLEKQCKDFGLNSELEIFYKYNIHRIVKEIENNNENS